MDYLPIQMMELLLDLIVFFVCILILFIPGILIFIYRQLVVGIAKTLGLSPINGYGMFNMINDKELIFNKKRDGNKILQHYFGFLLKFQDGAKLDLADLQTLFQTNIYERNKNGKYWSLLAYPVSFMGYIFMKPLAHFDLTQLIDEKTLTSEIHIEDFLEEWLRQPFGYKCPLWKILLIYQSNSVYLALKSHHGITDGYSLYHILDELSGNYATYQVKDYKDTIWSKIRLAVRAPRAVLAETRMLSRLCESRPLKCDENILQCRGSLSFGSLSLDKLKLIRRKLDVKFQSILLSLLTQLVIKVTYERLHELPPTVVASEAWPLPCHPFRQKIQNYMTCIVMQVPTTTMSRLNRLLALSASETAYTNKGLERLFGPIRAVIEEHFAFMSTLLTGKFPVQANLSCALLSEEPYYILGQRIETVYPLFGVPFSNIEFSLFTTSQNGKFNFTLIGNRDIFTDRELEIGCKYIETEFEELCNDVLMMH